MNKGISNKVLFVIAAVTLFLPIDLVPDTIPVIGWLDDLASIIFIVKEVLGYIRQRQLASTLTIRK